MRAVPFTGRLFSRDTPPPSRLRTAGASLQLPQKSMERAGVIWMEESDSGKNKMKLYFMGKKIRAGCRWHTPLLPALEGRGSWSQCEFGQLGLQRGRSCLKVKLNLGNNTFIYLLLKMCVGIPVPKHTRGGQDHLQESGVSSCPPTTEVSRIKPRLSAFVEGTWTCHAIPLALSKQSVHSSFSLNIWTKYSFKKRER